MWVADKYVGGVGQCGGGRRGALMWCAAVGCGIEALFDSGEDGGESVESRGHFTESGGVFLDCAREFHVCHLQVGDVLVAEFLRGFLPRVYVGEHLFGETSYRQKQHHRHCHRVREGFEYVYYGFFHSAK